MVEELEINRFYLKQIKLFRVLNSTESIPTLLSSELILIYSISMFLGNFEFHF